MAAAAVDYGQVEEQLALYSRATRSAMDDMLAEGQPATYLYDLVREYPSRAGKAIRPALLLAACEAFGGRLADGLRPAVALELLHNAFLIHDDIEDASPSRRGAPSLHTAFGLPLAVNAGDALAALALEPLLHSRELGSRVSLRLVEELLNTVRATTEGQALELGWQRHGVLDLEPGDYVAMAVKKSCWYTTVSPLRIGSIVGGRDGAPLDALTRFGLYLGLAFQIRDDLLSIVGSGEIHGKEALGDIREGKRTLILIHLLGAADPADRSWLAGYLAAPEAERVPGDAERVLGLMHAYGSVDFAADYAAAMAVAAEDAFEPAFAGAARAAPLRFIRGLIGYMVARAA